MPLTDWLVGRIILKLPFLFNMCGMWAWVYVWVYVYHGTQVEARVRSAPSTLFEQGLFVVCCCTSG